MAEGLSRVQDIIKQAPGLSMRSAGPGLTEYEARGLASNGGAAPTVGFYLDEIPLSPPAVSQSGKIVIDPDLYDVERVEVLRRAAGQPCTVRDRWAVRSRCRRNEPKLGTFGKARQGNGSYTDGGSGNGSGNLMLNFPLGDTMAVRLVLSDTYRSGWINNSHRAAVSDQLGRSRFVCTGQSHDPAGDERLPGCQRPDVIRRRIEPLVSAERGFLHPRLCNDQ